MEKIMDVQGTKGIVFASLGDVTADLPQGNDLARIKRHGATRGIEPVMPPKIPGQLTILISCVITILQTEIAAAPTITRCKEIATSYRLRIQCSKTLVEVLGK